MQYKVIKQGTRMWSKINYKNTRNQYIQNEDVKPWSKNTNMVESNIHNNKLVHIEQRR